MRTQCPYDGAQVIRRPVFSHGAMIAGLACEQCGSEWTEEQWSRLDDPAAELARLRQYHDYDRAQLELHKRELARLRGNIAELREALMACAETLDPAGTGRDTSALLLARVRSALARTTEGGK